MSNNDPKDLFKRASSLNKQMKLEENNSEKSKKLAELRNIYRTIILLDVEFSDGNKISSSLWLSFYGSLKVKRMELRKLQTKSKDKKDLELQRVESMYKSDLDQAILFYENLLSKMKQEYNKENEFYKRIKFNTLMYLGDIYRYYFETNSGKSSKQKFHQAIYFYKKSYKLFPKKGFPFNQIGVTYGINKERLESFYYSIRSLSFSEPFEKGLDNIKIYLSKAILYLGDSNNKRISDSISEVKNRTEKDINLEKEFFFNEFFVLFNHMSPLKEENIFSKELLKDFISHFCTFNKKGYLPSSVLTKMIIINIFSYCAIVEKLPSQFLENYKFSTKKFPNQQIQFCLLFFGSMMKSFLEGPPRYLNYCFGAIHIMLEWMKIIWSDIERVANKSKDVERELTFSLGELCSFLNHCFSFEDEKILYPEGEDKKSPLDNENVEFVGFFPFSQLYSDKSLNEVLSDLTPKELYSQRKEHILSFIQNTANKRIKMEDDAFVLVENPVIDLSEDSKELVNLLLDLSDSEEDSDENSNEEVILYKKQDQKIYAPNNNSNNNIIPNKQFSISSQDKLISHQNSNSLPLLSGSNSSNTVMSSPFLGTFNGGFTSGNKINTLPNNNNNNNNNNNTNSNNIHSLNNSNLQFNYNLGNNLSPTNNITLNQPHQTKIYTPLNSNNNGNGQKFNLFTSNNPPPNNNNNNGLSNSSFANLFTQNLQTSSPQKTPPLQKPFNSFSLQYSLFPSSNTQPQNQNQNQNQNNSYLLQPLFDNFNPLDNNSVPPKERSFPINLVNHNNPKSHPGSWTGVQSSQSDNDERPPGF